MYIVSTFNEIISSKLAIEDLEQNGIYKDKILAIPLGGHLQWSGVPNSPRSVGDASRYDAGAFVGTAFMVIGVIYGYLLTWGPIIWGLIGLFLGFLIGYALDLLVREGRKSGRKKGDVTTNVVLIVRCDDEQIGMIEGIFNNRSASGLGLIR